MLNERGRCHIDVFAWSVRRVPYKSTHGGSRGGVSPMVNSFENEELRSCVSYRNPARLHLQCIIGTTVYRSIYLATYEYCISHFTHFMLYMYMPVSSYAVLPWPAPCQTIIFTNFLFIVWSLQKKMYLDCSKA